MKINMIEELVVVVVDTYIAFHIHFDYIDEFMGIYCIQGFIYIHPCMYVCMYVHIIYMIPILNALVFLFVSDRVDVLL